MKFAGQPDDTATLYIGDQLSSQVKSSNIGLHAIFSDIHNLYYVSKCSCNNYKQYRKVVQKGR